MISIEHREAIREANKRRAYCCVKCGAFTETLDGSKIGGFPGIQYKYCGACGWSRAITKKERKVKL